ncbi:KpsF/GutQ family sugar-phosphate isomerase [Pectobacterium brasiliense]|uniref:KpsF/GutQ family sugar-phosphate isomerase n=1 Tax=Pectobacterium brasiliense TaxID=180957 RepID=UPI0005801F74|nr:KpsF/GutQ family sugar-phosphate isomerase [Pectobacterium brasiliense]KHT39453.1 arabinose 5-phosphate isomerase [Pectobacterium brasiliense]
MSTTFDSNLDYVAVARHVFNIEAKAVAGLSNNLDEQFNWAVRYIIDSKGRIIICGMGKSGIIGKKVAATMASTGTPSFFMHPGEAYHGDLGMVTHEDVFVAISNSGETDEVVKLLPFLKDNGNILIAITGNPDSTLARAADCHLNVHVKQEACPLQLAPTSSTTATLAMGDALAITLMEARGFKPENFARFHPGGSLGRRLLSKVEYEMFKGTLPLVEEETPLMDVIATITRSSLGLAIVHTKDSWAVITDGDVRRALERHGKDFFDRRAVEVMTRNPVCVAVGTRTEDALQLMERKKIAALLVFERDNLVGIFKK